MGSSATPLIGEDLELRVSPRLLALDLPSRPRRLLVIGTASVLVVAYGVARDRTLTSWALALGICLTILAIPNIGARLYARLAIRSGVVEYRGMLGATHRSQAAEICRGVRVRIEVLGPRFPFTRLLLLDGNDHVRLSIQEEWWTAEDLVHFQQRLGLRLDGPASSITARRANQLYPGAASFALRHRFSVLLATFAASGIAIAEILRLVHPNSG
jgi:hypothetical protein